MQQVSGHVFRMERARGPVWYAKYRLPSGSGVKAERQVGRAEVIVELPYKRRKLPSGSAIG
jgi:hypothetical protein